MRKIPAALLICLIAAAGAACSSRKPAPAVPVAPPNVPALQAPVPASLTVGADRYTLPAGVDPADVKWASGKDFLYWAAYSPGQSAYYIRRTPLRPGGGSITEGAVPVGRGHLPVREHITGLMLSGDWLIYTMHALAAEGGQVSHQMYGISLANPQGSMVLASYAGDGPKSRLLAAAGDGFVAWQWQAPQGPDDRYVRGETVALSLENQRQRRLEGPGWANGLRIEDQVLKATYPGGHETHHPLARSDPKPGEAFALSKANVDDDPRPDDLTGMPDDEGQFKQLWIMTGQEQRLDLPMRMPAHHATVVRAPGPVVLVEYPGGSMGTMYDAFAYSPKDRAMVRLQWGTADSLAGFLNVDPDTRAILVAHRMMDYARHLKVEAYTYDERAGRLTRVAHWYGPHAESLSYPASPEFVLLAALTSVSLDLPNETPRYFANPQAGSEAFRQLRPALPWEGAWGLVGGRPIAEPYPGDGVPVGFQAEATTPGGKASVKGTVSFGRQGGRYQIQSLTLEPILR